MRPPMRPWALFPILALVLGGCASNIATANLDGTNDGGVATTQGVAQTPPPGVVPVSQTGPAPALAYPAVHDMPPDRAETLTDYEQQKLLNELARARDRLQKAPSANAIAPQNSGAARDK